MPLDLDYRRVLEDIRSIVGIDELRGDHPEVATFMRPYWLHPGSGPFATYLDDQITAFEKAVGLPGVPVGADQIAEYGRFKTLLPKSCGLVGMCVGWEMLRAENKPVYRQGAIDEAIVVETLRRSTDFSTDSCSPDYDELLGLFYAAQPLAEFFQYNVIGAHRSFSPKKPKLFFWAAFMRMVANTSLYVGTKIARAQTSEFVGERRFVFSD